MDLHRSASKWFKKYTKDPSSRQVSLYRSLVHTASKFLYAQSVRITGTERDSGPLFHPTSPPHQPSPSVESSPPWTKLPSPSWYLPPVRFSNPPTLHPVQYPISPPIQPSILHPVPIPPSGPGQPLLRAWSGVCTRPAVQPKELITFLARIQTHPSIPYHPLHAEESHSFW